MGKRESNLWVVQNGTQAKTEDSRQAKRMWSLPLNWLTGLGALLIACATVWLGLAYGQKPDNLSTTSSSSVNQSIKSFTGGSPQAIETSNHSQSAGIDGNSQIQVDVHGDVHHPGVVSVPQNARVEDAIQAAGGLRHASDAININQAAMVWDGEEVDVPVQSRPSTPLVISDAKKVATKATSTSFSQQALESTSGNSGRININTADAATLETLSGVGPKRAAAIIQYRLEHGPFATVAELANIRGIGPKTLAKWSGLLFVNAQDSGQAPMTTA